MLKFDWGFVESSGVILRPFQGRARIVLRVGREWAGAGEGLCLISSAISLKDSSGFFRILQDSSGFFRIFQDYSGFFWRQFVTGVDEN